MLSSTSKDSMFPPILICFRQNGLDLAKADLKFLAISFDLF